MGLKLDELLTSKRLLIFLILVNIIGFIVGLYYLMPQLTSTSSYYWLFVIDSPLYVILFAFICFLIYDKRKIPRWLPFITSIGLIKTGFWTVLVSVIHFNFFASDPAFTAANIILHIFIVIEGLMLAPRIRISIPQAGLVIAWFLLNDFMDYTMGTHTYMPETYIIPLAYESIIASVALSIILYILWGKRSLYE